MESWPRITTAIARLAMVMADGVNMERNMAVRMFPYLRSSKVSNASPSSSHIVSRRLHITGPIPSSLMCCTWWTISCTSRSLSLARAVELLQPSPGSCLLFALVVASAAGQAQYTVICHHEEECHGEQHRDEV